ncbi:galactosyltransferase-domain-containing protein [Haematococcus lacustris]
MLIVLFLSSFSLLATAHIGAHNITDDKPHYPSTPRSLPRAQEVEDPESYLSASAVVGVFSSGRGAKFRQRRELIRATWASSKWLRGTRLEVVFVVERPADPELLQALRQEQARQADLVLVDPQHTTAGAQALKTWSFLLWAAQRKPNASFVVKMDEDVWLHPHRFQRLLSSLKPQRSYWGIMQHAADQTAYMAKQAWVLSTDLVLWVQQHRSALMAVPRYSTEANEALLVGRLVSAQGVSVTELEAGQPAAEWEVYDWGPDAALNSSNAEAVAGLPPQETLVVHRLKRTAALLHTHDLFLGSLMRWSSCAAADFHPPGCLAVLRGEQGWWV